MSLDQQLRSELQAATETVPNGPDLAISLRQGRRRRRTRRLAAMAGTATAVAAVAITAVAVTPSASTPSAHESDDSVSPAHLPYPDYVAGTAIDQTLQDAVSEYVPWIGAATDVYPSDWTRDDALPDADFEKATDWEAFYDVGAHENLIVAMGFNHPNEHVPAGCHDITTDSAPGAPDCHQAAIGDGVVTTSGYRLFTPNAEGSDTFTFITSYQTPGGFQVNALDRVLAGSWTAANAMRELDDVTLTQLVTDPTLTFPKPVAWPE